MGYSVTGCTTLSHWYHSDTHKGRIMKLSITIESGNAAVEDSREVAALVQNVAERIEGGFTEGRIVDYNGHAVGSFTYTEG